MGRTQRLLFSPLFTIFLFYLFSGANGLGREDDGWLYKEILRDEAVSRINQLGQISDADAYLERTFLSPASLKASNLIQIWMQDAGLITWVDQMGNVHGRVEAKNSTGETLLIGSHMDTVVDAGKYDGVLGIVCAISALKVLKISGGFEELHHPVEVIAFSDEEGVMFQSTFLGSATVAGILSPSMLQISGKSGLTLQDVLKRNSFEGTKESLDEAKYEPSSVLGYIEVHMEQGPVLESLNYPLSVVSGIAGQSRLKIIVNGWQGHAGTVPMYLRQDAMAASAEIIVSLESLCKRPSDYLAYEGHYRGITDESLVGLVCTVGEISVWPGASNVIPSQVNFTVDIRDMDDVAREAIIRAFTDRVHGICNHRMVDCLIEHKHNAKAVPCDPQLSRQLKNAALKVVSNMRGDDSVEVPALMSGAGHDAMAMSHLTKVGMLFVRCRGGVSHSPDEYVSDEDVWAAGLAIVEFLGKN